MIIIIFTEDFFMSAIRSFFSSLPKLSDFAVTVLKIGIALCCGYIIIAAAMHLLSFVPDYYITARFLFPAAIENGAGCLLSSVIAALICDVAIKRKEK